MASEAIHEYFNLTYANYLVLPRTVLQSMPDKWQEQFVELLNQIPELLDDEWEPQGGYRVLALDADKKFTKDPYSNYERGRRRLKRNKPRRKRLELVTRVIDGDTIKGLKNEKRLCSKMG